MHFTMCITKKCTTETISRMTNKSCMQKWRMIYDEVTGLPLFCC